MNSGGKNCHHCFFGSYCARSYFWRRGNSRNILAAAMNVTKDDFYRLEVSEGILKQAYSTSQFTLLPKNLLRIEDILGHEITLWSVSIAQSSGSGQGFVKYMCKTKWQNMICLCVKNEIHVIQNVIQACHVATSRLISYFFFIWKFCFP